MSEVKDEVTVTPAELEALFNRIVSLEEYVDLLSTYVRRSSIIPVPPRRAV